jgi:hypothetical protein
MYDVIRHPVFRENIALRAAELPILIKGRQIVTARETNRAVIGMSRGRTVYSKIKIIIRLSIIPFARVKMDVLEQ